MLFGIKKSIISEMATKLGNNEDVALDKLESFIFDIKNDECLKTQYVIYENLLSPEVTDKQIFINLVNESLELLSSYDKKVLKESMYKLKIYENNHKDDKSEIIDKLIRGKINNSKSFLKEKYKLIDELYESVQSSKNETNEKVTFTEDEMTLIESCENVIDVMYGFYSKKEKTLFESLDKDDKEIASVVLNGSEEEKKEKFNELKEKALDFIKSESEKGSLDKDIYESSENEIKNLSSDVNKIDESILVLHEILK